MKTLLSRFPIKWRITIWTTVILFFLFSFFAVFQYFFIKNWIMHYEKTIISEKMREVQAYLSENKAITEKGIINSKHFLENIIEKNEFIQIEDKDGKIIVSLSNDLSTDDLPHISNPNQITSVKDKSDHYLIYKADIADSSFKGTVELIRRLENYTRLFKYMSIMMIIAVLGAILLSSAGGILIANQILKPVKALSLTIQKIKAKGLKERVPELHSKDEIAELSHIFNGMMDDLEISFNKQKRFVEDASHELRTPISILEGHLSMLKRWGKKDHEILEESIAASLYEVKRLKDLVTDLLDLTRIESTRASKEIFDPILIIENVIKSINIIYPNFTFTKNFTEGSDIRLFGVRRQFEQLIVIITDNAIKYSKAVEEIKIVTEIQNQQLLIHVIDYGEGIPNEDLPYIFDRFYRVDKARSRANGGNGLGLSIAKEIVENLDGTITVKSELGQGTMVSLCFPILNF
ncbi:signal transduction histidine kinase [Schinkia azotoformans MEV2011]|uniref:Signal transduction histidine-protein kinase ArlS n=1 Tax=Schinkia azotoformans MEV2011 TaxID=1348973 RepID=A0A072NJ29_SCHAZ|nr:HAMP domain-containing histidine kinase [Schinkia azotoformans]KEF37694.1 signal transduction histidine kinase [Schinkia azotoformans MEV2011]MEC1697922.1 HAMP domain-containing histidine kinase [Schinkia azotoformans]MEC1725150.1 HAMP domain-containing histidine kinase [Schinkia azotoformans]MEC1747325.1 HAMP domain-containing histidine kinase [Schinkia azotoformans]MEC1758198.1 HAMP domain-containing histidine kinase [Schinkia azotoformans]